MVSILVGFVISPLTIIQLPGRVDVIHSAEPQMVADPVRNGVAEIRYAELRVIRPFRADRERSVGESTEYYFYEPRNVLLTLSCDIVTVSDEGTSRSEHEIVIPLAMDNRKHYIVRPVADLPKGTCEVDVSEA